jgi:hypothetical protein
MKSDKLIEAYITTNSTPQIQLDTYLNNVGNTEQFIIEIVTVVFRLPKKQRTYQEMESELTQLFMRRLSVWEILLATLSGLKDSSGPIEGIKKSIIIKACTKMGYINPLSKSI